MTSTTRQAVSAAEAKTFDTEALRRNFLLEDLFALGRTQSTYLHLDRLVVGSAVPLDQPLELPPGATVGTESFLDRRELGIFLIAGQGSVEADNQRYELAPNDCLYLPMGSAGVRFTSTDPAEPARFYFVSAAAHQRHAAAKITQDEAIRLDLGSQPDANRRVLRQYIHPARCTSCQLVMGMTALEDGSVWNTMPCHRHERRSEVYLYFDMTPETRIFHFMGEPEETRHMVVADRQAIVSPSWSIHCAAGTGRYAFVWSMAGDNQVFTDMDAVAMDALR